jgi:hypothetical protein
MIEFDFLTATHQITPERLKATYATTEVIDTVLSWLAPQYEEFPTTLQIGEALSGPQTAEDYMFEFYLDQPNQIIGVISGDIPLTRAIIDLKKGTFTEQVGIPFAEGSGPVTELDPEVLSYLRTLCEDLALS